MDNNWAETELKFLTRQMTKSEYRHLCRRQRLAIRRFIWDAHYIPAGWANAIREITFKKHLVGIRNYVKVMRLDNNSLFRPDAYRAKTVAWANVLGDRMCDEASDYVNPERDAMIAYERVLSDNFDALYGNEPTYKQE